MGAATIAPTYLAGKNSSLLVMVNTTLTPIPISKFYPAEKSANFDTTNPTGMGYEDVEGGTRSCIFSFTAYYRKATGSPLISSGAPPVRLNGIYAFQLNTQQLTAGTPNTYEGWSGNAIVTGIDTNVDFKGGTTYTGTAQFKGVYSSPDYPDAITDSIATPPTGDFALGADGDA